MYKNKKISVVLATYNEKTTIRKVIQDFFATGFVDEVVVVNNNAEEGTDQEVKKTNAKLFYEKKTGLWIYIQNRYQKSYRRSHCLMRT